MLDKVFKIVKKVTPNKWCWVFSHHGFRRYLVNTGWLFSGKMFSVLISFFISAWLARYLGPENYGLLNYVVAFVGIFGFIASFGVDGILNRELVSRPDRRDKLLGTAFVLKIVTGFLATGLAIAAAFLFEDDKGLVSLIAIFTAPFIFQSFHVISSYFQAKVKSKYNVRAAFFASIISTVLKVIAILSNGGMIWIIAVFALDSLWQAIFLLASYKRYGKNKRDWRFSWKLFKRLIKSSWPLMLASGAGFVYLRIDQVIIKLMLSDYDVGIYAAAVKIVEIWYFIPVIICSSLFPALVNARKIDRIFYKKRLKSFYILMFVLSFLVAIPVSVFAKPTILTIFGPDYLPAVKILHIYIWSSVGYFIGMAVNQFLITEGRMIYIFVINMIAMVLNITLNFILIPVYGLSGAALATLVSYFVIPASLVFFKEKD